MTDQEKTYRILMVIPFLRHVGGMEKQSLQLAHTLQKHGHEVTFLTTARLWEFFGTKRARVIESIEGFHIVTIPGIYIPIMKIFPLEFLFWGVLYLLFTHRSFDILHGHQLFSSGVVVGVGSRLFGIPSLVKLASSGETGDIYDINHRPFRGIKSLLFRSIDRFIAITPLIHQELQKFGISGNRIVHIPNGVDPERFSPVTQVEKEDIRKKLQLPLGVPIVLFDSRLAPSKRPEFIFEAWKEVHSSCKDALLLHIGQGRHGHVVPPPLLSYIHENGLESSILFRGTVNNPDDFVKAADLFTLGSRSEGLSNALLQAAACGLGIVVPNHKGNALIVQHEITGLLADLDNASDLAQKLLMLIQDESQRQQLGRNARAFIEEHFSLVQIARHYTRLYEELVRSRKSRV